MTAPLRIGILGAARIADEGVIAPSYTYQLARLAGARQDGRPAPDGIDGSVASADLIDECYRRAGLSPRGT